MTDKGPSTEEAPIEYVTWPPFPQPPPGVTIIPFKDFQPKGIISVREPEEEEEYDAEGVRTIRLQVEHYSLEDRAARDKAKRARKRKQLAEGSRPGAGSGDPNAAAELRAFWYEEWEEDEEFRKAKRVDPMIMRADRFAAIMTDFSAGRKFPMNVQSIYDHFRVFVGLLLRKPEKPNAKIITDDQEVIPSDHDSDDSDDMGPALSPRKVLDPQKKHPIGEDLKEEDRMELFLDDPVTATKIFLSSYYRDKGLFWSLHNLRDGPILLTFIYNFILRHRALPEYEKDFKKALVVVEQARKELIATQKLAETLTDKFGQACVVIWGSESDREVKREWAKLKAVEEGAAGELHGATISEAVQDGMEVDGEGAGPGLAEGAAPGTATEDFDWSKGVIEAVAGEDPGGWGDIQAFGPLPTADDNTWGADTGATWGDPVIIDTDKYFGSPTDPSSIPQTHIIVRSERSTRQIVSVEPPNPTSPFPLRRILGVITFRPWKNVSEHELSMVSPANIVTDDTSGCIPIAPHDPSESIIRVLFDPSFIEVAQDKEGMGIGGLWVQVAEKAPKEETEEKPEKKKSRSKGKSKSKNPDAEDAKAWWYLETSNLTIPSFWTDYSQEGTG